DADHGTNLPQAVERLQALYRDRPSIAVADALGWALYKAGRCREADRYARESLALGSRDALLLFHAGRVAACAGEPQRARDLLGRALAINPSFSVRYAPEARQALSALQAAA